MNSKVYMNDSGKGYKAADWLKLLGYVACFGYAIFGVTIMLKAFVPGVLVVFGSIVGFLMVYLVHVMIRSLFILRDTALGDQKSGG